MFIIGCTWFGPWPLIAGCSIWSGQVFFDCCRALQGIGPGHRSCGSRADHVGVVYAYTLATAEEVPLISFCVLGFWALGHILRRLAGCVGFDCDYNNSKQARISIAHWIRLLPPKVYHGLIPGQHGCIRCCIALYK
ncbi:hypothetical protein BDW59DRAFT_132421 [Aspergillus cavernicola]|uniref:Uncharacterized protein n=1 Tax=Aspergillus cavernicola TaxID=176166 RepID=A0ABR4HPU5_9EURO